MNATNLRIAALCGLALWLASCATPPTARPGATARAFQDCTQDCPQMRVIPAGSFVMGSPATEAGRTDGSGSPGNVPGKENRELQHTVRIAHAFALQVNPVTRAQFASFVAASGYVAEGSCFGINTQGEASVSPDYTWRMPGFPQTDNDPVVCVTDHDAEQYAAWLAKRTGKPYRLPTEAEYEYAARAGTTTARYWGESADQGCPYANGVGLEAATLFFGAKTNCNDGHIFTAPVGSYQPNGFGLNDMLGNVWVWMQDCWHDTYEGAPTDGSAWREPGCTSRVMRGGSFISNSTSLRSAARHQVQNTEGRFHNYGIRVAYSL